MPRTSLKFDLKDKRVANRLLRDLQEKTRQNEILPRDFMQMVVKEVGGPQKMARIVAGILTDAGVAAVAKQRTLSDLMRLMQHVETKSSPPPDLTELSTEDLEATMAALIAEYRNATPEDDAAEAESASGQ
jgi:hypothetical protein